MRWSLPLGSVAGIRLFVHVTFLLLIAWVAYESVARGEPPAAVAASVAFMLAVFACVLLHELGHALMGRRFGVRTRDITLLPIGGVARLERIPSDPVQELWIALAGPAVNVLIAAVLAPAVLATRGPGPFLAAALTFDYRESFLGALAGLNIWLVIFNMIPAFPMDGGRVLRALLALRLSYRRATRIAAGVGQVIAVLFVFVGFTRSMPILVLIGVFVWLGAQAESHQVDVRAAIGGVPVRDAMVTRFRALSEHDTLADASRELLAGTQQDFPVVEGDRLAGVLGHADLIRALASRGPEASVGDVMRRDCRTVEETQMLDRVVDAMSQEGCPLIPVTRDGRLVGLLTKEHLGELMMINSALRQSGGPGQRGSHRVAADA
jgi:Zn-dependent protease/CBS domain-containing protein